MAAKTLVAPVQSSPPVDPSPATAALADGEDVHARFLARLRAEGLGDWSVNEHNNPGGSSTPERCAVSLGDPIYGEVDMDSSIVAQSRQVGCDRAALTSIQSDVHQGVDPVTNP